MRLLGDILPKLLKWWTVIGPKFEEAVKKFDSDVELEKTKQFFKNIFPLSLLQHKLYRSQPNVFKFIPLQQSFGPLPMETRYRRWRLNLNGEAFRIDSNCGPTLVSSKIKSIKIKMIQTGNIY